MANRTHRQASADRVDWRHPTPKVDELLHESALEILLKRCFEAHAASGGGPPEGTQVSPKIDLLHGKQAVAR
jgi:hypothetical protein